MQDVSSFTVELRNVGVQVGLSGHLLSSLEVRERHEPALRQMLVGIYGEVVVSKSEYSTFPADWWQGVKLRWFPGWLKVIFPVRFAYVEWWKAFPEAPEMLRTPVFNWQSVEHLPEIELSCSQYCHTVHVTDCPNYPRKVVEFDG